MPPAKASKKGAKGTFINPARVTDLATWAAFYKSKYQNLKIDYATGNPVVQNPENPAEIVKTIPLPRAIDSYRALNLYRSGDKEKYTTSLQMYNTQREEVEQIQQAQIEALQVVAVELAQAIIVYKQGPTSEGAKRVAILQKKMMTMEKEGAPTREVKTFEWSFPPAGNVPPAPAKMLVKYTSMPDKREVNFGSPVEVTE
jgi:hypothetical protein